MTYDDRSDTVRLSSGREFYAHLGLLSVDTEGTVFDGYDGVVQRMENFGSDRLEDQPFTDAERRELADAMIARWEAFAKGEMAP